MTQAVMPKLLIVEDQPAQREALQLALEGEYEVRTASDGPEALAMLAEWAPDLMITDHAMPEMTGLDIVREIENKKASAKDQSPIHIILCSARLTPELARTALALGVAACVGKPFELSELRSLLRILSFSPLPRNK